MSINHLINYCYLYGCPWSVAISNPTRNKSIVLWRTMHTGRILSHERPLREWS